MKIRERHRRSALKGLTYTGAVIIADIIIVMLVTHRIDATIEVLVLTNIVSLAIYYVHARIWASVAWGHNDKK